MRDLHLSKHDIDNMSYAQIYIIMECIKEVNNKISSQQKKADAMLRIRPGN